MKIRQLTLAILMLATTSAAVAEVRYTIEELLAPPGAVGLEASAMNDRGQVVGFARFPEDVLRPVAWEGTMPTLITGGEGARSGVAQSINNLGHVAVTWWDDMRNHQVAVSEPGGTRSLRALHQFSWSNALALNDAGHAVGFSQDDSGRTHAVLWRSRAVVSLGVKGEAGTMARDIDNAGQIVGVRVAGSAVRPFRWHHGLLSWLKPLHEGAYASAVASNNSGRAVGDAATADGRYRAVLWSDVQPIDLGTLPQHESSGASDINDVGAVVGTSYTLPDDGSAVLWQDGHTFDLNDLIAPASEWRLYHADAINDLGQVVGRGTRDGREAIYLLTPVPEPAHLSIAFVATAFMRRRRIR